MFWRPNKILKVADQLNILLRDLNTILSPFLILVFFLALSNGTMLQYGMFGILFNELTAMRASLTLQFLGVSTAFIAIVWMLANIGQRLQDSIVKTCDALEDFSMENENATKVQKIRQRLLRDGVVSPSSFFNVNHAGYLGMIGTIITYLIVLLQFRVSESTPEETPCLKK